MKQQELEELLSYIMDWDNRDYKYSLKINTNGERSEIKIYIIKYNFVEFMNDINEAYKNMFADYDYVQQDAELKLMLKNSIIYDAQSCTDTMWSNNKEQLLKELFIRFLCHLDVLATDQVKRTNAINK